MQLLSKEFRRCFKQHRINLSHIVKVAAILAIIISLGSSSIAQELTRESLELKKKRLSTLEGSLAESLRKNAETEAQLKALSEIQSRLQNSIKEQEEELSELREDIPIEEEELAFLDSPLRTIVAVSDSDTYLIDFGGARRSVKLHGIYIDPLKRSELTQAFKKRLVKKSVYVRCADTDCNQVYLYGSKKGASLNAELVQAGFARAADDSKYDVASFIRGTTATSSGSNTTPGTDVHVRGYYRKDGTYVRPHTRSAPGTKSGGSSGRSGSSSRGGSRRR